MIALDQKEPILVENPNRFTMFPIKYPQVWEMYKKAEASFWTGKFKSFQYTRRLFISDRLPVHWKVCPTMRCQPVCLFIEKFQIRFNKLSSKQWSPIARYRCIG